jgi:hypothetical protein
LSEGAEAAPLRGGTQVIPRPALVRAGPAAPWNRNDRTKPDRIPVAAVRSALERRGEPNEPTVEVATVEVPVLAGRPAAVLCALFDDDDEAQVVLTRRSSRLRSHTGQVSFPRAVSMPGRRPWRVPSGKPGRRWGSIRPPST